MSAPPYVCVSGLTADMLSIESCLRGILFTKVLRLYKGGNDVDCTGFGWLTFLRADKKDLATNTNKHRLTIANKKFMHYNDDVLLPFIKSIHIKLGWKPGEPIPEWITAISWFDGDIPQLQTMLCKSCEKLIMPKGLFGTSTLL